MGRQVVEARAHEDGQREREGLVGERQDVKRLGHGSQSLDARCAATRSALAAIVSAGLMPALEGKKEASTTYRLSSW